MKSRVLLSIWKKGDWFEVWHKRIDLFVAANLYSILVRCTVGFGKTNFYETLKSVFSAWLRAVEKFNLNFSRRL